jgi:uncharacterized iron-regulated protein
MPRLKIPRQWAKALLFCAALSALSGCAALPSRYVALFDRSAYEFGGLLSQIEDKPVIFVGEGHTNYEDHLVQLSVIRRLHEKGKAVTVAMEMFPTGSQQALNDWTRGRMPFEQFLFAYEKNWTVPFDYYEDIFFYARDNGIPLVGINTERAFIGEVARRGLQAASGETLEAIRYTTCAEDPLYERTLSLYEMEHVSGLPYLCEAQRLRDSIMAYLIAKLAERHGGPVVVLLGAAHAGRQAVPSMLERHGQKDYVILMPASFGHLLGREVDIEVADYIWY